MTKAPWAPIHFAKPNVSKTNLDGGGYLLQSNEALKAFPDKLSDVLLAQSNINPDRVFLAERDSALEWRRLTFSDVHRQVLCIAQSLLNQGLTAQTPIAILSDNGVDNALLQLAAMHVGIPVVPISPAYSLLSTDLGKLKHIIGLTDPALVYVNDPAPFESALNAIAGNAHTLLTSQPSAGASSFSELLSQKPSEELALAAAKVGPDTVAKILFTSGSTGLPKGVINTQRMMCSNQQAIQQMWPFLADRAPVIVDWLPWNHTFGGNHNFNMMLFNGGTLYIDHGKPVPHLITNTVDNLRELSPTLYFNVPKGFNDLLPYLEADSSLRDHFFSNLDAIFYAGAALPQDLWDRLENLSTAARGERVPMISAWGATETSPVVTSVHFTIPRAGVIGLPAPGCTLKMVPSGQQLELRVKGPNVTPGYWRDDIQTREAFDDEGFYCIGDAGRFADVDDPSKGVVFDGRVAEDFKLTTGTWVHTSALRVALISAGAPLIQDAVITGHDRDEVGALIFPNIAACQAIAGAGDNALPHQLLAEASVRDALRAGLLQHNASHPGSSTAVKRVILLATPPDVDQNEITDKGYINQRAVLDHRSSEVDRLFRANADDDAILLLTE